MSVVSKIKLMLKLRKKEYRDAYVSEHIKTSLPIQIKILREQRGWSQEHLAQLAKTTQTVISRVEDPNYGKLNLSSLLKMASAFDIALIVKFVPFSKILNEFEDVSPKNLRVDNFEQEVLILENWATEKDGETRETLTTDNIVYLNDYRKNISAVSSTNFTEKSIEPSVSVYRG